MAFQPRVRTRISRIALGALLFTLVLVACGSVDIPTPTPAPTSIECPVSDLGPNDLNSINPAPTLIVILVESAGNQSSIIDEAYRIIGQILPRIIAPGDQIAIFRHGYREYDDSAILDINHPELQILTIPPSPAPPSTLAVSEAITPTRQTQLGQSVERNEATATAFAQQGTATVEWAYFECAFNDWENSFRELLIEQSSTQEAGILELETSISATLAANRIRAQATDFPTPIVNSFYEGLTHTTSVFEGLECDDLNSGQSQFSRCVLIVFDNFLDWRVTSIEAGTYPIPRGINLANIDILGVMLNCPRIYNPDCIEKQEFWTSNLLEQYEAKNITYIDGNDIETEIRAFLGR